MELCNDGGLRGAFASVADEPVERSDVNRVLKGRLCTMLQTNQCPPFAGSLLKAARRLSAEVGQQNRVGVQPLNVCSGGQSRPRVPSAREPLSAQLQLRRGYQVLGGYH